ncbi:MAG TPA: phosphate ABC transporter permease PstA [Dermatophilaceae bacterium]|nr:phosphate ABC transporter permease PstA [Dermatophilaceae bacterium]
MPAPTEKFSSEVQLAGRRASNSDKNRKSMIFLGLLWLTLLIAFGFLVVLLVTTFIDGIGRYDSRLFTNYNNTTPEEAGARAGILGSIWVIAVTAIMAIPVGIGAALYLEEFSNKERWYNKFFELNIQNLAAVPAILYGLLTLGFLTFLGVTNKNVVIGGALALALLILPVIILTTREALRAVPREIRDGSLALGATEWQTAWRQTLPASVPGIATGTILALSRAMGEAAPLLLLGVAVYISYDPNGLLSGFTTLPIQIFNWTSAPQEEFRTLAAAASILLMFLLLAMNGVAIYIRNHFSTRW